MQWDRTSHDLSETDGTPAQESLSLRLYPDSVLRTKCEPVDRFDTWLADVYEEMLALMRYHDGIGLAGPQAGLKNRLFVAELGGETLCLANPVMSIYGGRNRMEEGCLSLPDCHVEVDRNLEIEVKAYDVHGRHRKYSVHGLWARVIQHEIDHLDGVLICDYQKS